MRAQLIFAAVMLLAGSALAAGSVVRPAKPSGTWYPFQLGTDRATAFYNGYKATGTAIKTLSTPYPQGCYWACLTQSVNANLAVPCYTWAYEGKAQRCTLLKNPSTNSTGAKGGCASWAGAKGFVSGWVYDGEESPADNPPCPKA